MKWRLEVAVQTPAHSALGGMLSYASDEAPPPGTLVRVPLGRREVLGVVWEAVARGNDGNDGHEEAEGTTDGPGNGPGDVPGLALKPVAAILDGVAPLADGWRDLVAFAARYYQRSLGEVALAALPPQLRDLTGVQLARRLKRRAGAAQAHAA
ncbi:MAG: priA, partial [Variovorax sp.]|nr:priA [Variovorax sp.]